MDIQTSRSRGGGSSETREKSYDVYLSFRGPDTREGFVDHLYERLLGQEVRVFKDDEELVMGEDVGASLRRTIRLSKIAIPILSESYASSRLCLMELAQIVEYHKTTGQIIMPVFFNVTPSVVKNKSHGYGEAIARHRERGIDPDTLRKGEEALSYVGSIPGLEIDSWPEDASLIDVLVANVLRALNRYFVGIEHHVEIVMKLLNVESSDIRVVGIHGIGGTGKTTIARFIYKRIFDLFDGCSFLKNIREHTKKPGGLDNLQGQLVSDLLGVMHGQIHSVDDRIKSIRRRFLHKKVLIVLDDFEPRFGLTPILSILDSFGSGSRIIITTRDEQALDKFEVFLKYGVWGMREEEVDELFCTHAFRERPAPADLATLSKKIVLTIGRLPLTVEVVGSYLYSKSKEVWEQTLNELRKVPEPQLQQKLMVIIKALPDEQRLIFLDIACFFIGEDKSVACYMWSDRDSTSGSVLEVLINLSIVKIENDKLWMHDQLRDLGRDIVIREHLELGERSRLWSHEQARVVLVNKTGTESVRGILLKFGSGSQYSFGPAHFARMSNIRFLRLDQANLEGNFERHLSSLRWLHWQGCPRHLLAEKLDLKELVILDLSWSKVNDKWNGWSKIKKAKKLRVLNLTGCFDMIRTPDLSHYKCLERLILERCIRLEEIGSSVKSLKRLVSLNLRFCAELNKLPEELGSLISLEEILIDETAVEEIPASIGDLQKLRRFSACNCLSLIQLPDSISHVKSMRVLALHGTKITNLPLSGKLEALQHLSVNHCRSILKLPLSLGTLASLIELDLSSTLIVELPSTINELYLLRVLKIDLTFVRELPCAIWTLKRLEELHASKCRNLDGEISEDIKKLSALRVLRLGYSRIPGLPDTISELTNLQKLDLRHCDELRKVPNLPSNLKSLSLSSKLIDTISDISTLDKLEELFLADGSEEQGSPFERQIEVIGCFNLWLGSLSDLKILQLSLLKIQLLPVGLHLLCKLTKLSLCCIHLKKLPKLPPGLFTLSLHQYKSGTGLPDLSYLELLSEFELSDCAVTEVAGLGEFKSLRVFRISHCDLQQLDELTNLIFLASLNVSYCRSLERLPDLSKLKKLKDIKIMGCPKIPDFESLHSLLNLLEPSSSIIEVESSSEAESSEPAYTEHSSFEGAERNYEGNEGWIDSITSNDDQLTEINSPPDGCIGWGKVDKIGKILKSSKVIGRGSNGTIVYEGTYDGRLAAVKRLVLTDPDDVALREIDILMTSDRHQNIVRYYGKEKDQHFVYLALELCTCSLDDLIQAYSDSSNNPGFPDDPASTDGYKIKLASVRAMMPGVTLRRVDGKPSPLLLQLMRDVVLGLSELHRLRVIHRDLKPNNVLITKNPFGAKLSDMSISTFLPDGRSSLGSHATSCGTRGWQAPEQLLHSKCQKQAMDLFSLGCVLFFCITGGKHPFGANIERDVNIASNKMDLFLVKDMPEAYHLFSHLLSHDPELRPTALEVLDHPFFWSSKMRLTFLHDVSDEVESEARKGNSDLEKLENIAQLVFDGNWIEKIDEVVMDDLRRHRRKPYVGSSVEDLLRVVRNKFNHSGTAPKEVEVILGSDANGLDAYFTKRFPKLLIESYKVVSQSCKKKKLLAGVLSK